MEKVSSLACRQPTDGIIYGVTVSFYLYSSVEYVVDTVIDWLVEEEINYRKPQLVKEAISSVSYFLYDKDLSHSDSEVASVEMLKKAYKGMKVQIGVNE